MTVRQEDVVNWIVKCLGEENCDCPVGRDNRGPDLVCRMDGNTYYIEAISFSDRTRGGNIGKRGKNQSDFWKAFAQAISRLNPHSPWGKPQRLAIALPAQFRNGWHQRVNVHGRDVWHRIGNAFPELEIWFVSDSKLDRFTWNEAFDA